MIVSEIRRALLIACVVIANTAASQAQQSGHAATGDSVIASSNRATSDVASAITNTAVSTPGGTNGLVPVFTGASTIANTLLYYNTGGLGIGRFPAAPLDVLGKSIFRGAQVISRAGDATSSGGQPSFGLIMQSSVYNSNNKGALLPYFQLQTEPTGNNSTSTAATFNFLYYSGVGSAVSETGLYFNPNGTIHFAPAQTFPIAAGPQGPVGPQGPAGAKGATGAAGPQGPAGPALSFPYYGSGTVNGNYMLNITNNGDGGGGYFSATTIGDGLTAFAGISGTEAYSAGGNGMTARGGAGAGPQNYGGSGGNLVGGDSPSGGYQAGDGLDVFGGSAYNSGNGGYAVYAVAGDNAPYAAYFGGNVSVGGNLAKSGGSFRIDDPEDPANKYLSHSFVESPDMMNIYNGNAVTDGSGTAIVTMPTYFESLNRDFRYQLTIMGHEFAQALVASEIANGSFTIKTDKPNIKVSWQVTGVRQDAWANAHRIPVEEDKPEADRGKYLHPELFGRANEANIEESHRPNLPRQKRVAPVEVR